MRTFGALPTGCCTYQVRLVGDAGHSTHRTLLKVACHYTRLLRLRQAGSKGWKAHHMVHRPHHLVHRPEGVPKKGIVKRAEHGRNSLWKASASNYWLGKLGVNCGKRHSVRGCDPTCTFLCGLPRETMSFLLH